jgi:site-specific DNA-cytosine methylase
MENEKNINWASIIPLIGGMTIANINSTCVKPKFIVSWPEFAKNDSHITKYLPDVDYHFVNDSTNPISGQLKHEWYEKLDFVSTTCPCAGLSLLNNSTGGSFSRGSDAAQNDWMYKSAEWVFENLRPKVFWGENAPGLYTSIGDGVRDRLKEMAADYGYSFSIIKTDTHLHGIPQHRRRTFYFFWRDTNAPILNWHQHQTPVLSEYLKQIPKEAPYQDKFFTRSTPVSDWKLYEYILERTGLTDQEFRKSYLGALYHYVSKKGWVEDAIKWLDERYPDYEGEERPKLEHIRRKMEDGRGFWDSSPFFVSDHVNAIIGKNMHVIVHPTEDRFLNIRECMWLMGLPHDFVLNEKNEVWNHIAQNVPVKTASDWTSEVLKYVNGELKDSGCSYIMQDNTTQRITYTESKLNKKIKYKTQAII